jgi:selenocysteine-specific elongation factor
MTLDIGYAHMALPNGRILDFVDVPGHDRLVGNMLVGAGEIDAALLVVAADDGPRAQTLEHLTLLDALDIRDGVVVVTKADLVVEDRLAEVRFECEQLLSRTSLAPAPVVAVSSASGLGLPDLIEILARLEERVAALRLHDRGHARLPIDRVFSIRGRGTVVTGTLRGAALAAGDGVSIEPGGATARVREAQARGAVVRGEVPEGRTALNLAGVEVSALRRGQVLASGPAVEVSNRLLVSLRRPAPLIDRDIAGGWPPPDGSRARLHLGTEQVGVRVGRAGREAVRVDESWTAVLRLDSPVAVAVGDHFVLRRPSPASVVAGGVVLDAIPPRGPARRRVDERRLRALERAVLAADGAAVVTALAALHGLLPGHRAAAILARLPGRAAGPGEPAWFIAEDVARDLDETALAAVVGGHASRPLDVGLPLAGLRQVLADRLRRSTSITEPLGLEVAGARLDGLIREGRLARDGDRLRDPTRKPGLPDDVLAAMDRLEELLSAPAPPPLAEAARLAGCPPDGVRALEAAGRIVRLETDLAWSKGTYQQLAAEALSLARRGPLSPAAFRDATGTSRRYVLAILEDLDRRGILTRGTDGHRPGPRAPSTHASGAPPA